MLTIPNDGQQGKIHCDSSIGRVGVTEPRIGGQLRSEIGQVLVMMDERAGNIRSSCTT